MSIRINKACKCEKVKMKLTSYLLQGRIVMHCTGVLQMTDCPVRCGNNFGAMLNTPTELQDMSVTQFALLRASRPFVPTVPLKALNDS
jgi:hypothetical protein